jgi:hypothetical protein
MESLYIAILYPFTYDQVASCHALHAYSLHGIPDILHKESSRYAHINP